jgi:hypothetical protein
VTFGTAAGGTAAAARRSGSSAWARRSPTR